MRLRRHATAILLTSAAVVLSGMVVPSSASAAPLVGGCYDYPAKTIGKVSSAAPAIGCEAPHTAETYWVGALADAFGLPSASTQVARLSAGRPCTVKAMNDYLGMSDRTLPTRFRTVVLFPTDEQWNAGERWVRCDVVLQGGLELKPVTGTAAQLVAITSKEIFNFCTPKEPNIKATFAYPCLDPKKNWIKVLDQELGGPGSAFPGTTSVDRRAIALCQKMGKRYQGKDKYPGWWRIYPTASGWKQGRRSVQCFVPYKQYLEHLAKVAPAPTPTPAPSPTPTPTAEVAAAAPATP
jgi:hypothetical protein